MSFENLSDLSFQVLMFFSLPVLLVQEAECIFSNQIHLLNSRVRRQFFKMPKSTIEVATRSETSIGYESAYLQQAKVPRPRLGLSKESKAGSH